jgi:hypothetical protein
VLFALNELQREVDIDEAIGHLRDLVPGYLTRREDLMSLASAIASKRELKAPDEAQAARILFSRIKNERLGNRDPIHRHLPIDVSNMLTLILECAQQTGSSEAGKEASGNASNSDALV